MGKTEVMPKVPGQVGNGPRWDHGIKEDIKYITGILLLVICG
jgi:hypothetical protein